MDHEVVRALINMEVCLEKMKESVDEFAKNGMLYQVRKINDFIRDMSECLPSSGVSTQPNT